jgi:hypothetical protein
MDMRTETLAGFYIKFCPLVSVPGFWYITFDFSDEVCGAFSKTEVVLHLQ